jgi:hypothetical protein
VRINKWLLVAQVASSCMSIVTMNGIDQWTKISRQKKHMHLSVHPSIIILSSLFVNCDYSLLRLYLCIVVPCHSYSLLIVIMLSLFAKFRCRCTKQLVLVQNSRLLSKELGHWHCSICLIALVGALYTLLLSLSQGNISKIPLSLFFSWQWGMRHLSLTPVDFCQTYNINSEQDFVTVKTENCQ